jgi:hypothetical protein
MKLDGKWISEWAAQRAGAEDALAGGALTHRGRQAQSAVIASASADVEVVTEPIEPPGYGRYVPATPLAVCWESA